MSDIKSSLIRDFGLRNQEKSLILKKALTEKSFSEAEHTALMFYDLSFIDDRINRLKKVFPETALHAIAVKANPLIKILSRIKNMGVGLEVASLPEIYIAEKAGFAPENIVFDSPCKTREEIEYALQSGIYINADSFAELDRIGEILKTRDSESRIGLRINPQVGTGSIKSTSVAGTISKFGVPLNENRQEIIELLPEIQLA
jgi:diaminopimelate decarboxylase